MKPFQPRTLEQQRKNYVKACKQRMSRELSALEEEYREEIAWCARLYSDKCKVESKVAKIQDRIANAADKEFGGWDAWRHDEALLAVVIKRMDDAVVMHKKLNDEIDTKMEIVMQPYRQACKKVTEKYATLMRTA